jgi:hypothetical protein
MVLAQDDNKLILQQSSERKSFTLSLERTNSQIQFAAIKQIRNIERAARPKIQSDSWSNFGNTCCYRGDQNDGRIVVGGNVEGLARL